MQLTAAKRRYITHHILFEEKMLKEDLTDLVISVIWKYGIQMINIISISL
jgi:RNase P/RNase MRP subunit POP5